MGLSCALSPANSIPGLSPLDASNASSVPPRDNQEYLETLPSAPSQVNSTWLMTTAVNRLQIQQQLTEFCC